jgi:DNA-binding beta-propeller fold protein YncE
MTHRHRKPHRHLGSLVASLALAVGLGALAGCEGERETAEAAPAAETTFQVDPFFPRDLPNDWVLGQVTGISVDDRDHVWIVHRPGSLTDRELGSYTDPPTGMCCDPAPPVLEFDPEGNMVRAWGGPGDGYEWPETGMGVGEHGIHVDHTGHVWIGSGPGGSMAQVLKFTRDGEFVLQIGRAGQTGGSNDTELLGGPAAMEVDPETNEVYIADGYVNRRVIVFDAETGEYRRHWGAYGNVPNDDPMGPYDPEVGAGDQFLGPVHGITISRDGEVFVTDRRNNRIQVFERDGTFLREGFIRPETLSMGSTWDVALSRDPDQRWLYVPDGTNYTVWVLDRHTLEVAHRFGRQGRNAGQFQWVHNLAVDSHGNIFTSEVDTGKRVQKFVPANP